LFPRARRGSGSGGTAAAAPHIPSHAGSSPSAALRSSPASRPPAGPVRGMKDPQVLGKPGRHERQNRLGEAAQSPDYPVTRVTIDSSRVHGQNHDARGARAFHATRQSALWAMCSNAQTQSLKTLRRRHARRAARCRRPSSVPSDDAWNSTLDDRHATRASLLHRQRTDPRTRLVACGRPRAASSRRRAGRRPPPFRAPSASPRARGRDGPRGRPLIVIQRQLGHTNLGITSIHLQGIDNAEIVDTIHARRPPMIAADILLPS
jgi:hypothetical protein